MNKKIWALGVFSILSPLCWVSLLSIELIPEALFFPLTLISLIGTMTFFFKLRMAMRQWTLNKINSGEDAHETLLKVEEQFRRSPHMTQQYATVCGFSLLVTVILWVQQGFSLWWSIAFAVTMLTGSGTFSAWYYPRTFEERKKNNAKIVRQRQTAFTVLALIGAAIYVLAESLPPAYYLQIIIVGMGFMYVAYVVWDYRMWCRKK